MQPQYIARQHAYARLRLIKDAQRLGFYARRKRRRRRKWRRYERPFPGANVQIDIKYLDPIGSGPQEYQYTAIDEHSRLRVAQIYDEITPRQATLFLREALDSFDRHGIRVRQVQTDHGSQFTYAMFPHVQKEHPFERELRREGIAHKLTPVGKPHLQGKVERSHRIDQEHFHQVRRFPSSPARQRAFAAWITYYNHQRPHGSLNWRPPAQHLKTCRLSQSVTYD